MFELKDAISNVPDFPRPGILFRDISPLLRDHFDVTVQALDALLTDAEWADVDALAGIESRGFILGAALASHRGKGFVLVRKQGKLQALAALIDLNIVADYAWRNLRLRAAINY
jgi:adenine phosphoribosyltransferase